jgi:hypothetical protein
MENRQMLPFITDRLIPDDLIFDIEDTDNEDFQIESAKIYPADILRQWKLQHKVSEECIPALSAILVREPENWIVENDINCLYFLKDALEIVKNSFCISIKPGIEVQLNYAHLLHINALYEEAEIHYKESLKTAISKFGIANKVRLGIIEDLIYLMDITGNVEEKIKYQLQLKNETDCLVYMQSRETNDFINLRGIALNFVLNKNYKDAEEIYKWLINRGFETPGTHNHMARLCALQERIKESKSHLEIAWKKRQFAKKYVPPRVLFLQILILLIEGKDISKLIIEIKKSLISIDSFLEWTIEPLILQYKHKLASKDFEFLICLSRVLNITVNNPEKQIQLASSLLIMNSFPIWYESEI